MTVAGCMRNEVKQMNIRDDELLELLSLSWEEYE
jgi:hypothetical protein